MIIGSDVLDALTDLGILRDDRDDVVGRDLDEGVRNKRLPGSLRDDSRNRIEVHAATSMPPPANADTRRNDRRSSWNAGFFVISTLVGFGLQ